MSDYLFDQSCKVFETVEESDEAVLFLDYDGTLVFFKDKPNEVFTPKEIEMVLKGLILNPKFTVFIISGRMLYEIKKLLNMEGLSFVALHGLQIELSDGKRFNWKPADNPRPLLEKIKENISNDFREEKGVYIEDKELTLAFHYRMLSKEKINGAVGRFIDIVKNFDKNNSLEVINGEKVIEIRPRGWDKGKATEFVLNNIVQGRNALPIYIGDDATDEDAFKYLGNQGLTIFVSNNSERPTLAQYWLKDPDDVLVFLKSLLEIKKRV